MTATTLTRCELYRMPAEAFLRLVETSAELSLYLAQMLGQQYYDLVYRYAQIKTPARSRVAALLLQCVPESGRSKDTDIRLELPASRHDLTGLAMITPEHFSRMLHELKSDGVISERNGWLIVSSLERLVQESEKMEHTPRSSKGGRR